MLNMGCNCFGSVAYARESTGWLRAATLLLMIASGRPFLFWCSKTNCGLTVWYRLNVGAIKVAPVFCASFAGFSSNNYNMQGPVKRQTAENKRTCPLNSHQH